MTVVADMNFWSAVSDIGSPPVGPGPTSLGATTQAEGLGLGCLGALGPLVSLDFSPAKKRLGCL